MAEFILYHTEGCHLCHQAEALLLDAGLNYALVDICDDDTLAERYGVRIPVVLRTLDSAELGWPFNSEALASFKDAAFNSAVS